MKIRSDSFEHGKPIPPEFALGARDGGFGGNRNPHLAWSEVPAGTAAFALLCIDTDAPTDPALVADPAIDIPVEHPRGEFVHWVVADIPADARGIAAGSCSDGVTRGGKGIGHDAGGMRGLNDYTGWFAGDGSGMRGDWYGYDGPFPPPHDARIHRYFFRLFALDAPLGLPAGFTAADVQRAMHGHVLAEAATYGTYSLHDSMGAA